MTDIATLGLAIDSRQAVKAKSDLDALAASGAPVEKAFGRIESSSKVGLKSVQTQTGLARHELINLSRQAQDVGVSLASGQSPLMVLAQQGTQIADIFASSRGTLREFATQLRGMISPTLLLGAGIVALGVGAYAAFQSWKSFALQLDDTARIAGETTDRMARLQAAASFKGIDGEGFGKGVEGFSRQLYLAQQNAGSLVDVLRVNGVRASKDFSSNLGAAANIIKNASGDQQRLVLLQQMGLPATMEWVRFMSQGADGIKRATEQAAAFGGAANDQMVRKAREFDEAWNRSWTNFGLAWRSTVVDAVGWLERLSMLGNRGLTALGVDVGRNLLRAGLGTPLGTDFDAFYKATGANRTAEGITVNGGNKPSIDPEAVKKAIQDEQTRLGILGQTASVLQQVRAVELQVQSARLNGIPISKAEAENLKHIARERALGITTIRASADAYRLEAATIGMSVGEAAAFSAVQQRINQARRDGQTLSATDIANIRLEAAALGEAAQRASNMRDAYETFRGTLQDVNQQIQQHGLTWEAFGNAGVNALNRISAKLMDMAADNLWKSAFGGGGGGWGGGMFSSLFGGGGQGGWDAAVTAATMGLPGNAGGTNNWRGGLSWVGEEGPEIVNLPRGSQVVPNDKIGGGDVHVPIVVNINGAGGDSRELVAKLRAELPHIVIQSVKRAKDERRL